MEATSKKDVNNLVESIIKDANEKNGKLLFVKYSNTFSIKFENVILAANKSKSPVQTLYHEFKQGAMQPAYCPLMDWIGALYKRYFTDISYLEFLEVCDVYPLHRNVFATYFEVGTCRRTESIIANEVEYESGQFLQDIVKIFNKISESIPLLLIFDNLHFCEKSLLTFLNYLTGKDTERKFSVFADFNEKYEVDEYMADMWDIFSTSIETQNMMLYWEFDSMIVSDNKRMPFVPEKLYFGGYLIMLNNMVNMLCLEQAINYSKVIADVLEGGDIIVGNREKYLFYNIYGNALFLNKNYDEAIEISKVMKKVWSDSPDLSSVDYEYNFNELACHAYIYKHDEDTAMDYVLECKRLAYGSGNGFLMFQADLLRYTAMMRGWDKSYLVSAFGVMYEIDPDFLSLAKKYNYVNNLAYVTAFGYGNDQTYYRDSIKFCSTRDHVVKSTEIANSLKNEYLLLLMWDKHIQFTSRYGYYGVTDYYYKCELEVYKKSKNFKELGIVYNGLGYNRIIMGHYNYASEYFNSAINVWYTIEMPEQIGMTLYNMAINAILMEDYSTAIDLINTTLHIMKYINQLNLEYCNASKLYGMMVYCDYKLNMEYNAQFYLNKMEYILHHLIYNNDPNYNGWDNELFLYYLNRALLRKKTDADEAQRLFDRAKYHMERSDDLYFFVYMLFAIEQSAFYKEKGDTENFIIVLNKCINHFKNHGCNEKADRLFSLLNNKSVETKKINAGLTDITTFQLVELSSRVGAELELNVRNDNISFLSGWQRIMNDDSNLRQDVLLQNSVKYIKKKYDVDGVYMFDVNDGKMNIVYADDNVTFTPKRLESIQDFFKNQRPGIVVTRNDKLFYDYSELIEVFGINDVFSMICVPTYEGNELNHLFVTCIMARENFTKNNVMFNEDDFAIMKFAFHQYIAATRRLQSRIEIQKMNAKLEQNAITDLLTGLLNRKGLRQRVEEESAMLIEKNGNTNVPTTVLYIDLDNFKYYNDTFGHDVGDVLLVSFAKTFAEIVNDNGYSVRYGGDEFIVIMPNASEDDGVEVAKKIYQKLDESNGFETQVRAKVGYDVVIPKSHRVSCSIGIATAKNFSTTAIDDALKNADSALYVVKKSTKRNYRVWRG